MVRFHFHNLMSCETYFYYQSFASFYLTLTLVHKVKRMFSKIQSFCVPHFLNLFLGHKEKKEIGKISNAFHSNRSICFSQSESS